MVLLKIWCQCFKEKKKKSDVSGGHMIMDTDTSSQALTFVDAW